MHADYAGQGVDQLAELVDRIKRDPTDRRLILSAWNPAALHEMALPPCHMMAQFYVADGELSCQVGGAVGALRVESAVLHHSPHGRVRI